MKIKLDDQILILEHCRAGNKNSGYILINKLDKNILNKYSYKGVAYRVLVFKKGENIDAVSVNLGESFSNDKNSINQFLEDIHFNANGDELGIVVEAEIIGFNLKKFIQHHLDDFKPEYHDELESYLAEQEILLLELVKVIQEYSLNE